MKRNPIFIALIIGILVLILIGGMFYFFQWLKEKPRIIKTDEELTANWKVYQGQELGFTIKYPSEWEDPKKVESSENGYKTVSISGEDITIEIEKFSSPQNFEEEASKQEKYLELRGESLHRGRILLDEVPAKRITYFSFQYQFQGGIILIEGKEGQKYIIKTYIKFNPKGKKEFILDQILSTFKFLE